MGDLKVCEKCGWYDGFRHAEVCSPAQGRGARALAKLVKVQMKQLGYGHGKVTFEFHEDMFLHVDVAKNGLTFTVRGLFCLGAFSKEDVAELINAMAATKIGRA